MFRSFLGAISALSDFLIKDICTNKHLYIFVSTLIGSVFVAGTIGSLI